LKPVQRHPVAMNDLAWRRIAATQVRENCGDTSAITTRNGEAVIYPTLVRLAQSFNMRYPLIDGRGITARWTAIRPRRCGTPKRGWRKSAKKFRRSRKRDGGLHSNFDQRRRAGVLPSRIRICAEWRERHRVGMATKSAAQSGRIIDARFCSSRSGHKLKEIMKLVPGPDFPTRVHFRE